MADTVWLVTEGLSRLGRPVVGGPHSFRACVERSVGARTPGKGRPVRLRAIVVGAGIGGLTAAVSLSRAGCEVTVVERASRFGEIGAGIQLAPNATRVLRRLDLLDAR